MIAGRTSALAFSDLPDAVRRAKAYEQAGVDAVFLVGASTRAEVQALNAELKVPLLLGGAKGELNDKAFLAANGVRVSLQGHLPFAAAVKAVHDTMKALRDGVPPAELQGQVAPAELMAQATRHADYKKWIAEFLT